MEAGFNEDVVELNERKALHDDGKYRAIAEGNTTRMAHDGSGPSQNIGPPSAYYEVNQVQCSRVSRFNSTSTGQFPEQVLLQLGIQVKIQVRSQWMSHRKCPEEKLHIIQVEEHPALQVMVALSNHIKNHKRGNNIDHQYNNQYCFCTNCITEATGSRQCTIHHNLPITIMMKSLLLIHYSRQDQVIDTHAIKAPKSNREQGH